MNLMVCFTLFGFRVLCLWRALFFFIVWFGYCLSSLRADLWPDFI